MMFQNKFLQVSSCTIYLGRNYLQEGVEHAQIFNLMRDNRKQSVFQ